MDDTHSLLENNRKNVLIGLFLVVVIMFLATIAYLVSSSRNGSKNTTLNQNENTIVTPKPNGASLLTTQILPPPDLMAKEWQNTIQPRTTTASASVYAFKQNYTSQEARAFISKLFSPTQIKDSADILVAYAVNDKKTDLNAVSFHKASGSFSFLSSKGVPAESTNRNDGIYDFLKKINIYDETIQVSAEYKKLNRPGVTFIELHRNWQATGMPILNMAGLLNLPSSQSLEGITINTRTSDIPQDSNIYATSDNKNGLDRQDDFNTITIVIRDKDNSILSVNSNIRKVEKKLNSSDLISYDEAKQKIQNNEYTYLLSNPSGSGTATWDKVYPFNFGVTDKAVITEARYAYIENLPVKSQKELQPYVVFKGYAELNSGYRTNFYGAVPANKANVQASAKVLGTRSVNALLAQRQQVAPDPEDETGSRGNQQSKLDVIPSPFLTPLPDGCQPPTNLYNFDTVISIDGIRLGRSTMKVNTKNNAGNTDITIEDRRAAGEVYWYYIPSRSDLNEATFRQDFMRLSELTPTIQASYPDFDFRDFRDPRFSYEYQAIIAFKDFAAQGDQACPVRVSGGSPTVFIYGKDGEKVNIKPSVEFTYTDPSVTKGEWNVTLNNGKLNTGTEVRDYLYYEYVPVAFEKPEKGWNVKKKRLKKFADRVGQLLHLNSIETERLFFELNHAASSIDSTSVFIGLVDENEVNKKIPLDISPPSDNVHRYHFYVGKTADKVVHPELTRITRTEYMILEFGSYAAK